MRKLWWLIIPAAFLAATAGCACNETGMERGYGDSHRTEIANQTLHPGAAQNLAPVTGMGGQEASKIYEGYVKGFEKPAGQMPATYIIPIGSEGGSFNQGQ